MDEDIFADLKSHRLDSPCPEDCQISELHSKTRHVLDDYPQLNWSNQNFHAYHYDNFIYIGNCARYPASIKIGGRHESPGLAREQVEAMNKRLLSREEYLGDTYSSRQIRSIQAWNLEVFSAVLKSKRFSLDVPLMPIQVLWYIRAGVKLMGLEQSEPVWFGFDLLADIASEETLPDQLACELAQSQSLKVRKAVASHPGLSTESKILLALAANNDQRNCY